MVKLIRLDLRKSVESAKVVGQAAQARFPARDSKKLLRNIYNSFFVNKDVSAKNLANG
jgi:hypothetical protein